MKSLFFASALGLFLSACAPFSSQQKTEVLVDFSRSGSALSADADVTLSSNYCYALHVTGLGHFEINRFPLPADACPATPPRAGMISGLFAAGTSELSLSVPIGSVRRFDFVRIPKTFQDFHGGATHTIDCSKKLSIAKDSSGEIHITFNGVPIDAPMELLATDTIAVEPAASNLVSFELEHDDTGSLIAKGYGGGCGEDTSPSDPPTIEKIDDVNYVHMKSNQVAVSWNAPGQSSGTALKLVAGATAPTSCDNPTIELSSGLSHTFSGLTPNQDYSLLICNVLDSTYSTGRELHFKTLPACDYTLSETILDDAPYGDASGTIELSELNSYRTANSTAGPDGWLTYCWEAGERLDLTTGTFSPGNNNEVHYTVLNNLMTDSRVTWDKNDAGTAVLISDLTDFILANIDIGVNASGASAGIEVNAATSNTSIKLLSQVAVVVNADFSDAIKVNNSGGSISTIKKMHSVDAYLRLTTSTTSGSFGALHVGGTNNSVVKIERSVFSLDSDYTASGMFHAAVYVNGTGAYINEIIDSTVLNDNTNAGKGSAIYVAGTGSYIGTIDRAWISPVHGWGIAIGNTSYIGSIEKSSIEANRATVGNHYYAVYLLNNASDHYIANISDTQILSNCSYCHGIALQGNSHIDFMERVWIIREAPAVGTATGILFEPGSGSYIEGNDGADNFDVTKVSVCAEDSGTSDWDDYVAEGNTSSSGSGTVPTNYVSEDSGGTRAQTFPFDFSMGVPGVDANTENQLGGDCSGP